MTRAGTVLRCPVDRAGISSDHCFVGRQLFPSVEALVTRLAELGEPAVGRARGLGGARDIDIEMVYRVAVLRSERVGRGFSPAVLAGS